MTVDPTQTSEPTTPPEEGQESAVPAQRGRFAADENGSRPFALYAVLGVGVAALLVLLAIIYFSSVDRGNPDQPICTAIGPADAQQAVMDGEISRIVVNYDKDISDSTDPKWGPVLSRLDYVDGRCGNLPQGIEKRDATTLVLGTILLYNETTNQPQVKIKLDGSGNLDASLFVTATSAPTITQTPIATSTPIPTTTIEVTSEAAGASPESPVHVATPSSTPAQWATPKASRAASPQVERRPTMTPLPTVTPFATRTPTP